MSIKAVNNIETQDQVSSCDQEQSLLEKQNAHNFKILTCKLWQQLAQTIVAFVKSNLEHYYQ